MSRLPQFRRADADRAIGDEVGMTNRLPRYRVRALHLIAVWAYGVSQPVFALVSGNQEMLIAENASRLDAIFVVCFIALVPPLLAVGYAWLASRLSRWIGDVVYVFLLGMFLAPVVLQLEKHFEPSALFALAVTAVLCALGVALYLRFRAVRLFVGFSIALPLVGLLMFARDLPPLTGEAHAAPQATVASPHPVVVLLLDEFPVRSLMTPDGTIDEVRYPNFARLAREGNWFPNATTVHDSTEGASPAILTGRVKRNGNLPIAFNYPDNLFSLLGDEYALDVHEAATRLCPREHCPQYGEAGFLDRIKSVARQLRYPYVLRVMPDSLTPAFREVDFDRVQGGKMSRDARELRRAARRTEARRAGPGPALRPRPGAALALAILPVWRRVQLRREGRAVGSPSVAGRALGGPSCRATAPAAGGLYGRDSRSPHRAARGGGPL